jgi:DNA polymerase III subunit delta
VKFSEFKQYRPKPDQNVFVFICSDQFLVEESRNVWIAMFTGNWVVERIHVKEFEEIEASRLSDDALTPSLFSQSRMLMVSNAEKVTKGRIEDLVTLRSVANSSLKIVLVVSGGTKSAETLIRTFPTVEIDELKPAEVARWLIDRYKVSPEIARYMVDNVGTELYPLHNELQKLKTYVGDARPIDIRDIDVLILRSEQFGPFELDDAILARDYPKAVRVVGAMIEEGVEPLMVLSRIVRVWRQLFMGKGLVGKFGAKEVAAAVMAPVWKSGDFVASCRKYEWKQLAQGFRQLLAADRAFKTSSPRPEAYLDVLLWKLIQPESR